VLKERPAGELIKTHCHARLNRSKQLLNDVIFNQFSDKKLFTLAALKHSQNDQHCKHLLHQRIKTLEQNAVSAHSDGDRQRVEIGLHQHDIHRSEVEVD